MIDQLDQKVLEKQLPGKKNESLFPFLRLPLPWPGCELAGSEVVHSYLKVWTFRAYRFPLVFYLLKYSQSCEYHSPQVQVPPNFIRLSREV